MFQSGCDRNQVSIAMRYEANPIILIICVRLIYSDSLTHLTHKIDRLKPNTKFQLFQLSSTFGIGFENIQFLLFINS